MVIRLLVTSVDEITLAGLRATLGKEPDFLVHAEPTGTAPIAELLDRFQPDVALADPAFLGRNGTLPALVARTGVLAYSETREEESLVQLLEAGVRGYVLRSDPPALLVMAIRAVAAERAFLSPSLSDVLRRALLKPDADSPTSRERQILAYLAEGRTNKHIANLLGLSVRTVEVHRTALMRKLGAQSAPEMMRIAIRKGLVDP